MASYNSKRQCLSSLLVLFAAQLFLGPSFADQVDQVSTRELYGAECRKQVGDIPDFSCSDGVSVPITVDGKSVPVTKNMTCDRPALLSNGANSDGQCVPNSRILSLSTETMQIAVMCRQKIIRPAEKMEFDEIDIVAHNPKTGATCWFQAEGKADQAVSGEKVPSPTSKPSNDFWNAPETTVNNSCGVCHDNDPFMFSPFVGQVWGHMPANPFGPYYHVDLPPPHKLGFAKWPTEALNPTGNTCIACHRIGVAETCRHLTDAMTGRFPEGADDWARRFPGSHSMPPEIGITQSSWNAIYKSSVDQIRSCCQKPDQPACRVTSIPAHPQTD
ncbi:hypothetical protein HFO61_35220 [Rhizobium leguminosarum]|uniref:hypothetical protein n=1 Tax=Rhizobium leguminosarum TaxID=384 RepID=UPI001C964A06|nr:hypothetical protein [Rhizobium leguminosarum]MBY5551935.1 hypothetical protein [Rhizobium leguminosarum]